MGRRGQFPLQLQKMEGIFFFFALLLWLTITITSLFQKKRPDRRAFAIEQGPHTYVGKPLEGQSAYTTHACGKERSYPPH